MAANMHSGGEYAICERDERELPVIEPVPRELIEDDEERKTPPYSDGV